MIFYADTLFKPKQIKEFINQSNENLIGVSDKVTDYNDDKSEFIKIDKNSYAKESVNNSQTKKHFTGLTFLKKDTVKSFKNS